MHEAIISVTGQAPQITVFVDETGTTFGELSDGVTVNVRSSADGFNIIITGAQSPFTLEDTTYIFTDENDNVLETIVVESMTDKLLDIT